MAYVVMIDDRQVLIDVRSSTSGFVATVDRTEHQVEIVDATQHGFTMIIDRKAYTVVNDKDGLIVIDDESFRTSVVDEQIQKLRLANSDSLARKELVITAPMPGLVLEVMVAEGETVTSGQGLFIVEAMKMQNEMKAPRDGVVRQVLIAKGQTVNSGDKLVIIE